MSNTLPEFKSFASIPRLKRGCVITEKLDGTNAQIWISDDLSVVAAASRNRWISVSDDNAGFALWVADHTDELRALGPGHHFGEWWGSGIQRRYGLDHKRFSLFNAGRWGSGADNDKFTAVDGSQRPDCCGVVPVLYVGPFSTGVVDSALLVLEKQGSVAAPGFMNPEGIVIYMQSSRSLYKVTLGGDGHKGAK